MSVQIIHHAPQLRHRFDLPFSEVGHKARAHIRTVFVGDATRHRQIIARARRNGKQCQRRGKQKEPDTVLHVKLADLGENRKRRVVDYHAAFWVVLMLIIAAGEEGPQDLSVAKSVVLYRPIPDCRVDVLRGIAVIRSQFSLELIGKRFVFLGAFALFVAPEVLTFRLRSFSGSSPGVGVYLDGFQALRVKTGDPGVKVQSLQTLQLDFQQLRVPCCRLAQPVVCQDVCLALGLRQIGHQHTGHLAHALRPGGLHPAVARDNVVVSVDQHRRYKAELPQAGPDLVDLLNAVLLGVVRVGDKIVNGDHGELLCCDPHRLIVSRRRRIDAASSGGPAGCLFLCHANPPVIPGAHGDPRMAARAAAGGSNPLRRERRRVRRGKCVRFGPLRLMTRPP